MKSLSSQLTPAARRLLLHAATLAEETRNPDSDAIFSVGTEHFLTALFFAENDSLQTFLQGCDPASPGWYIAFPATASMSHRPCKTPNEITFSDEGRLTKILAVHLAPAMENALHLARTEFSFYRPLELSTAMIFYALAESDPALADFLSLHGLTTPALRQYVYQIHGFDDSPLPMPEDTATEVPVVNFQLPTDDFHVMRTLDAAANRACEALRVLEDHVRFVLNDPHLSRRLKESRHRLSAAAICLPMDKRLSSRDTLTDVGTAISTQTEFHRTDAEHVLAANFSRLQEALRSLEEFSKITSPEIAETFQALRYESYTLQKSVFFTLSGVNGRLANARLYVLTDTAANETAFLARVDALLAGGADIIQLRDKTADDATLLARARLLRQRISDLASPTIFIVNDRPDVALASRADGVHVGQDELSVRDVRMICGPKILVGVSTHTLAQAQEAVLAGADYIGAGPTFPSTTKTFTNFPGLPFLSQIAAEIRLPAFAIGGISPKNLTQVLKTGIRRIAISSAITSLTGKDAIVCEVQKLKAVLDAPPACSPTVISPK